MTDKEKIDNEEHYVKPPSFFQMAKSFTKDLAKYVKEGAPNVTEEDYVARLDTCKECEFLIEKSMRCGACGCLLEHKAKWKTADCPKDKWEKQELSKEEKEAADKADKEKEKENTPDIEEAYHYYDANGTKIYTNPPTMMPAGPRNMKIIPPEEVENYKKENAERQKNNNTDSSD